MNDPPTFEATTFSIVVLEDSGPFVGGGFFLNVTAGVPDAASHGDETGQTLAFVVAHHSGDSIAFDDSPHVDIAGGVHPTP